MIAPAVARPGSSGGVAVVGASVAGTATATALRRQGYTGAVTLIDAQPHLPYDRPPLSKQLLLGTWTRDRILLHDRQAYRELGIALRLGAAAVRGDGTGVVLADGSRIDAERVVVATGLRARRMPGQPEPPSVLTLRSLDDAATLGARLLEGQHLVVVGGGFIGAEVASAARSRGMTVTLLEAGALPMARALGDDVGRLFAELLAANEVAFVGGATVLGVTIDGARPTVHLADGRDVPADTVVVGIGGEPVVGWLRDAVTTTGDSGIPCDSSGRAVGSPGVYAVGDVAAWPDPLTGRLARTEHWTSAREQADRVAAAIVADTGDGPGTGLEQPPVGAPGGTGRYVWTDQFGLKVQIVGRPELADRCVVLRDDARTVRRTSVLHLRDGLVVGCSLFSAARLLAVATELVTSGAAEATAVAAMARTAPVVTAGAALVDPP